MTKGKGAKGKGSTGTTTPPASLTQYEQDWHTAGEADVWTPVRRGDVIEGKFIDKFNFIGKKFKNENHGYKILTDEGMKIVFGTGRLDRNMEEVPKDAPIKITYLGKVKQGENMVHDWDVKYKRPVPF